jgi:methionyl-tRNA synthetase
MYVWFDALVNYISAIGWPKNKEKFESWWPGIQLAGKDNLRPQSAMWQSMLMAVGLPNSKQVFINGFINVEGQKMSKSLGNVINPQEMIERFGIDGTRYLLLTSGVFGEDWDVSWKKFTEKYNADLANGIGNLTSRILKLAQNFKFQISNFKLVSNEKVQEFVNNLELNLALEEIWKIIREDDKYIDENRPWELKKNNTDKFEKIIKKLLSDLYNVSNLIYPFLPETSAKIKEALKVKEPIILFPRIK